MSESETIAYLADRMQWAPGETGISSNAMVRQAIGGDPVYVDEFPRDAADLARCQLAYERAPAPPGAHGADHAAVPGASTPMATRNGQTSSAAPACSDSTRTLVVNQPALFDPAREAA